MAPAASAVPPAPESSAGRSATRHVGICVLRALVAAGAVVLLAAGIGVLIWAVTPQSGPAGTVVRGAIAGLGAANFLPPTIGGIPVTIAPLLLTGVCFGLVASAANRGRQPGVGPAAVWIGAGVVGLVYGAVVTAVVLALSPPGSEDNVGRGWAPVLLGLTAAAAGVAFRGQTWLAVWRARAPGWLRTGTRAAGAAVLLMLAGGAVAVAAGLTLSFGTAIDLSTMAAPSLGEGAGMVLLSLAFLPNAMVAGIGYTLAIGFQIGAGTYSPLGTSATELPAIPLLAAVPDAGGLSPVGLVLVVFPAGAALLIGWRAVRGAVYRRERLFAALAGSLITALAVTVAAAVAGGGVGDSGWARLWVPALGAGGVAAGLLIVVSATVTLVAGWGSVPFSERTANRDEPADADDDHDENTDAGEDPGEEAGEEPAEVADEPGEAGAEIADAADSGDDVADDPPDSEHPGAH